MTYMRTPGRIQTSVTLQDGCFGVGTLTRLAAMFVAPDDSDDGGEEEPEQAHDSLGAQPAEERTGEDADQLEAGSLYSSAAPTAASSGGLHEPPQPLSSQPGYDRKQLNCPCEALPVTRLTLHGFPARVCATLPISAAAHMQGL